MKDIVKIKLYWNFITGSEKCTYVATAYNLDFGQYVALRDTIGYILRDEDGSWSAFDGLTGRYLSNEPNKKFAMDIVHNHGINHGKDNDN